MGFGNFLFLILVTGSGLMFFMLIRWKSGIREEFSLIMQSKFLFVLESIMLITNMF